MQIEAKEKSPVEKRVEKKIVAEPTVEPDDGHELTAVVSRCRRDLRQQGPFTCL